MIIEILPQIPGKRGRGNEPDHVERSCREEAGEVGDESDGGPAVAGVGGAAARGKSRHHEETDPVQGHHHHIRSSGRRTNGYLRIIRRCNKN